MKNVTINLLDYFWKKGIKPIKDRLEELKEVAFSGKYSDLSGTPKALKNPNALTFTGAVTGSYDGSNDKSVKIPSVTNNLLATQQGTALDAVQGKVLDDKINTINGNLNAKAKCARVSWGTSITIKAPVLGFVIVNHQLIYLIWTAGDAGSMNSNITEVYRAGGFAECNFTTDSNTGNVTVTFPFNCGMAYIGV